MSRDDKLVELREAWLENADMMWEVHQTMIDAVVESPIEKLFAAALIVESWQMIHTPYPHSETTAAPFSFEDRGVITEPPAKVARVIVPQCRFGQYRADFMLFAPMGTRVVVELDGHDFHERTRAQASRDKARDRYMAEQGIVVLRFTGSEVHANPTGCVQQMGRICNAAWERSWRAVNEGGQP